jgi:hypothetical protein
MVLLIELLCRAHYLYGKNKMRGMFFIKAFLFRSIHFNDCRLSQHSVSLSIPLEELFQIMAKASGTSSEVIRESYSGANSFEKLIYRPFIGFRPEPNQRLSFATLDRFGFQSSYNTLKKPIRVKRILALGGSAAYGWGQTSTDNNWCIQLESQLNRLEIANGNDLQWQVINMAYPGSTTASELNLLIIFGKMFNPDYVIQLSGFNDMWFFAKWNKLYSFFSYETIYSAIRKISLVRILKEISTLQYMVSILRRIIKRRINLETQEHQIYSVW